MTASDARPPSEVCGTCGSRKVRSDGVEWCAVCDARPPSDTGTTGWWVRRRPVIVVDPAEARETIARVIADHYPTGYTCGETCDHNLNSPQGWAGHLATAVLAALAGQGQP